MKLVSFGNYLMCYVYICATHIKLPTVNDVISNFILLIFHQPKTIDNEHLHPHDWRVHLHDRHLKCLTYLKMMTSFVVCFGILPFEIYGRKVDYSVKISNFSMPCFSLPTQQAVKVPRHIWSI